MRDATLAKPTVLSSWFRIKSSAVCWHDKVFQKSSVPAVRELNILILPKVQPLLIRLVRALFSRIHEHPFKEQGLVQREQREKNLATGRCRMVQGIACKNTSRVAGTDQMRTAGCTALDVAKVLGMD